MSQQLFIAFVVFATVMFFTPGPNNVMLLASGLNFGSALEDSAHAKLAVFHFSTLIHSSSRSHPGGDAKTRASRNADHVWLPLEARSPISFCRAAVLHGFVADFYAVVVVG